MIDATIIRPIIIRGLHDIYSWYNTEGNSFLKSIFTIVGFKGEQYKTEDHFLPPDSLRGKTPLPVKKPDSSCYEIKQTILQEIREQHKKFSHEYLNTLHTNQLYYLLETYGSYIPSKEDEYVSLFNECKLSCAEAVILSKKEPDNDWLFIYYDISGIQNFIYNIISKGALKNLRSRSFFIELLSHHTQRKLLEAFAVHQANSIMSGGGSGYILTHKPTDYEHKLEAIDRSLNSWLLKEFNTRLHVSLVSLETNREELTGDTSRVITQLSNKAFEAKNRKFASLIKNIHENKTVFSFISHDDPHSHQCVICGNDSKNTDFITETGLQDHHTCGFCHNLIRLGSKLPDVHYIYTTDEPCENSLRIEDTWYLLSEIPLQDKQCSLIYPNNSPDFFAHLPDQGIVSMEKSYITKIADLKDVKDVILKDQSSRQTDSELLPLKENDMAQLTHLSQAVGKKGAHYIGALRMDADNMGKLIRLGFYKHITLQRLTAFSRQMNLFFKLTIPEICNSKKVQLIYAGGDDLFILGAWNHVMDIAISAGKQFSDYTCNNIDIGISAGLTIHDDKFPVSTMARVSKKALDTAKRNLSPCWECREDFPECPLFEQGNCLRKDSFSPFYTEWYAHRKSLIAEEPHTPYKKIQSRLKLALKWKTYDQETITGNGDNLVHEVHEYLEKPFNDLEDNKGNMQTPAVFFHKILTLLNTWYDEGVMYLPRIAWVLQKIRKDLSKTGQNDDSSFILYDYYLHLFDPSRFATLHMPLTWLILSQKQGEKYEST
ncbi:MAG: type III-A CRISPR-associated protein Cas10/Csm1 [Spirochaetales bacterium]|nr:type III-A CRISPR-associated protein Cas10/Csm1 [Spirochaetales bacterium]